MGSLAESASPSTSKAWDRTPRDASVSCRTFSHAPPLFGREPSPGFWLFLSLPSAEVRHVSLSCVHIWHGVDLFEKCRERLKGGFFFNHSSPASFEFEERLVRLGADCQEEPGELERRGMVDER